MIGRSAGGREQHRRRRYRYRRAAGRQGPITLAEARLRYRVTGTAEDALLPSLIKAAREAYEAEANVSPSPNVDVWVSTRRSIACGSAAYAASLS